MSHRWAFEPRSILRLRFAIFAGFKHIGATALALEEDGYEVPFAYEEAIGYMFGSDIKDKDGVAATVC